jgi:hypothetical protein
MNLRQIITEAIDNTILRQYATRLTATIDQLRNGNITLTGDVYTFANSFNEYCNNVALAINEGRIEPGNQQTQQQQQQQNGVNNITRWMYGGGRRYYPNSTLLNIARNAGLNVPPLNGVWNAAVNGYYNTKDWLGINDMFIGGGNNGRRIQQPTNINTATSLRELIGQERAYYNSYMTVRNTTPQSVVQILDQCFVTLNDIGTQLNS